MVMMRKEGKIDGHTYLIDAVHQGETKAALPSTCLNARMGGPV